LSRYAGSGVARQFWQFLLSDGIEFNLTLFTVQQKHVCFDLGGKKLYCFTVIARYALPQTCGREQQIAT